MMCDVCTDNYIGDEGSNALSHCLTHLTQLTHLNLSSECVNIDVLLGLCDGCCHIDVM